MFIYQLIINKYFRKKYSWKEVTKGVFQIINELKSRSFEPDIIVCLGRGGSIFGGLIAGNLGALRVCTMDRKKISSPTEAVHKPDFFIKPNITAISSLSTSDKPVQILLVTGEVVTGYDLLHARELLLSEFSKENINCNLITASFMSINHANYLPDLSYYNGMELYKAPPWRISRNYVNDRRNEKLFHMKKSSYE